MQRKVGCSECVCIAIESHKAALLKRLISRSEIEYRDCFWAPTPCNWTILSKKCEKSEFSSNIQYTRNIPVLHDIINIDLSKIGCNDCGHMRLDIELDTAFDLLYNQNAYILVSLLMMAKWHSTQHFAAERILRQSGKFDYSEPQFFHMQTREAIFNQAPYHAGNLIRGPLQIIDRVTLCCEFEQISYNVQNTEQLEIELNQIKKSSCASQRKIYVLGFFYPKDFCVSKYHGSMTKLFDRNDLMSTASFSKRMQRQIDLGANLDQLMITRRITCLYSTTIYILQRSILQYDVIAHLCVISERLNRTNRISDLRTLTLFVKYMLSNGIAFFNAPISGVTRFTSSEALLVILLSTSIHRPVIRQGVRNIVWQLLALGYGRRELHTNCNRPACDENLRMTRRILLRLQESGLRMGGRRCLCVANQLESVVACFDMGPLSLSKLARIAIRRSIGDVYFKRHIRMLSAKLPPTLLEYVAEANELLSH